MGRHAIKDRKMITIGNQVAGKITSHMTETNDTDPLH
jgi:hypothetical protein